MKCEQIQKIGRHVSVLFIIKPPLTYPKQTVGTDWPNANAWAAIIQPDPTMYIETGTIHLRVLSTGLWTAKAVLRH